MNIKKLEETIRLHNKKYEEGNPLISDLEYDRLVDQLKYLCFDSPVLSEVGARLTYGEDIIHEIPMGSLNKIKCDLDKNDNPLDGHGSQTLSEWVQEKDKLMAFSLKVDGIAGELVYIQGKLAGASSRGDGNVGKNLLDNVLQILSIPTELEKPLNLVLRGEFYIPKNTFQQLIEERKSLGDIVNERNICAGALNSKNPAETGSKGIFFMGYRAWLDGKELESLILSYHTIKGIKGNHFGLPCELDFIAQHTVNHYTQVEAMVKSLQKERNEVHFRTDGIVVQVDNLKERLSFGTAGKNPKGAAAFKFNTEQASTTLTGIKWNTSRFGTIVPTAEFNPVVLCDTIVKGASLNNLRFIRELHLSIGDTLIMEKSGDIIPHLVRVINKKVTDNINYPKYCNSCGFVTREDDIFIYCTNPNCKAIIGGSISNFLKAIGIIEPGEVAIENMVEAGLLKRIEDIYTLKVEDMVKLPRMSQMLAERYYSNIQENKSISLVKFLSGMPIKDIGESTWVSICNEFSTLEKIMAIKEENLIRIKGIGNITATSIVRGLFQYSQTILALNSILTIESMEEKSGNLSGLSFAFTGTLSQPRKSFEQLVVENGGVLKGISKGLNFLVVGENPTQRKIDRAIGATIINEGEFYELL